MRHSKILGQALLTDLRGRVACEAVKFVSRRAPTAALSRKSPAEFRCQVEAFPGQDLSKRFLLVSCAQSRLDSPGHFRKHSIGKDLHYHTAQPLIFICHDQELLANALVKDNALQLSFA